MAATRILKLGQCLSPIVRSMSCRPSESFQSSEIANLYMKYRPTYGSEVAGAIINFCKENASCKFSLALDVGCGSGQSTLPLVSHFQKVIGLDVSEAQIANAPTHIPNLAFLTGPAEDLSFLDDGSVDLVTVATALHWLDLHRFYPEVERVLQPGGVVAAYSYGLGRPEEPLVNEIVCNFNTMVEASWEKEMKHVFNEYRTLCLPFEEMRRDNSLQIEKCWSVDELAGFLSSWSSYHRHVKHNPTSGLLEEVKAQLQAACKKDTGEEQNIKVTFPIYMLMGRKPLV